MVFALHALTNLSVRECLTYIGTEGGALYYGKPRRRTEVDLDADLRATTAAACQRLHAMFQRGETPRAERQPKCRRCSLQELCMPDALHPGRSVANYLETLYG